MKIGRRTISSSGETETVIGASIPRDIGERRFTNEDMPDCVPGEPRFERTVSGDVGPSRDIVSKTSERKR